MTTSLASLLLQQTKAQVYSFALGIATAVGVPVSSWQAGDPTRALFNVEAEMLGADPTGATTGLEAMATGYISSGFLDYAHGEWLKIGAKQGFNVDVSPATAATTDVVLTNPGGGVYDIDPGDLTFKSSISGKTFRNTTGGHLAAKVGAVNGTLTVTVVADEPGSASSAGANEIDALITGLGTTTCSNAVAATGLDEQDESVTIAQCRAKSGPISPNGPREAYTFIARDATKSGTSAITRARSYGDTETGDVLLYLAGPGGAVSEPDRLLVQAAILKWSTPLCITPTVVSCANVVIPVTYELWVYTTCNKTSAQVAADIEKALEVLFASRPIGGDIISPATTGTMYLSLIESAIRGVFPEAFRVSVSSPAGDTPLTNGQVAALGTVTPTINLVVAP